MTKAGSGAPRRALGTQEARSYDTLESYAPVASSPTPGTMGRRATGAWGIPIWSGQSILPIDLTRLSSIARQDAREGLPGRIGGPVDEHRDRDVRHAWEECGQAAPPRAPRWSAPGSSVHVGPPSSTTVSAQEVVGPLRTHSGYAV